MLPCVVIISTRRLVATDLHLEVSLLYCTVQVISVVCVAVAPPLADLFSTPASVLVVSSTSTRNGKTCDVTYYVQMNAAFYLSLQFSAVAKAQWKEVYNTIPSVPTCTCICCQASHG